SHYTPTNYIFGLGKIFTDHLNHDHSSLHEVAYSAHYCWFYHLSHHNVWY
ncbi:hypothetical protein PISMIDRAFT_682198, partial [Pisolithus microcarpus 441]